MPHWEVSSWAAVTPPPREQPLRPPPRFLPAANGGGGAAADHQKRRTLGAQSGCDDGRRRGSGSTHITVSCDDEHEGWDEWEWAAAAADGEWHHEGRSASQTTTAIATAMGRRSQQKPAAQSEIHEGNRHGQGESHQAVSTAASARNGANAGGGCRGQQSSRPVSKKKASPSPTDPTAHPRYDDHYAPPVVVQRDEAFCGGVPADHHRSSSSSSALDTVAAMGSVSSRVRFRQKVAALERLLLVSNNNSIGKDTGKQEDSGVENTNGLRHAVPAGKADHHLCGQQGRSVSMATATHDAATSTSPNGLSSTERDGSHHHGSDDADGNRKFTSPSCCWSSVGRTASEATTAYRFGPSCTPSPPPPPTASQGRDHHDRHDRGGHGAADNCEMRQHARSSPSLSPLPANGNASSGGSGRGGGRHTVHSPLASAPAAPFEAHNTQEHAAAAKASAASTRTAATTASTAANKRPWCNVRASSPPPPKAAATRRQQQQQQQQKSSQKKKINTQMRSGAKNASSPSSPAAESFANATVGFTAERRLLAERSPSLGCTARGAALCFDASPAASTACAAATAALCGRAPTPAPVLAAPALPIRYEDCEYEHEEVEPYEHSEEPVPAGPPSEARLRSLSAPSTAPVTRLSAPSLPSHHNHPHNEYEEEEEAALSDQDASMVISMSASPAPERPSPLPQSSRQSGRHSVRRQEPQEQHQQHPHHHYHQHEPHLHHHFHQAQRQGSGASDRHESRHSGTTTSTAPTTVTTPAASAQAVHRSDRAAYVLQRRRDELRSARRSWAGTLRSSKGGKGGSGPTTPSTSATTTAANSRTSSARSTPRAGSGLVNAENSRRGQPLEQRPMRSHSNASSSGCSTRTATPLSRDQRGQQRDGWEDASYNGWQRHEGADERAEYDEENEEEEEHHLPLRSASGSGAAAATASAARQRPASQPRNSVAAATTRTAKKSPFWSRPRPASQPRGISATPSDVAHNPIQSRSSSSRSAAREGSRRSLSTGSSQQRQKSLGSAGLAASTKRGPGGGPQTQRRRVLAAFTDPGRLADMYVFGASARSGLLASCSAARDDDDDDAIRAGDAAMEDLHSHRHRQQEEEGHLKVNTTTLEDRAFDEGAHESGSSFNDDDEGDDSRAFGGGGGSGAAHPTNQRPPITRLRSPHLSTAPHSHQQSTRSASSHHHDHHVSTADPRIASRSDSEDDAYAGGEHCAPPQVTRTRPTLWLSPGRDASPPQQQHQQQGHTAVWTNDFPSSGSRRGVSSRDVSLDVSLPGTRFSMADQSESPQLHAPPVASPPPQGHHQFRAAVPVPHQHQRAAIVPGGWSIPPPLVAGGGRSMRSASVRDGRSRSNETGNDEDQSFDTRRHYHSQYRYDNSSIVSSCSPVAANAMQHANNSAAAALLSASPDGLNCSGDSPARLGATAVLTASAQAPSTTSITSPLSAPAVGPTSVTSQRAASTSTAMKREASYSSSSTRYSSTIPSPTKGAAGLEPLATDTEPEEEEEVRRQRPIANADNPYDRRYRRSESQQRQRSESLFTCRSTASSEPAHEEEPRIQQSGLLAGTQYGPNKVATTAPQTTAPQRTATTTTTSTHPAAAAAGAASVSAPRRPRHRYEQRYTAANFFSTAAPVRLSSDENSPRVGNSTSRGDGALDITRAPSAATLDDTSDHGGHRIRLGFHHPSAATTSTRVLGGVTHTNSPPPPPPQHTQPAPPTSQELREDVAPSPTPRNDVAGNVRVVEESGGVEGGGGSAATTVGSGPDLLRYLFRMPPTAVTASNTTRSATPTTAATRSFSMGSSSSPLQPESGYTSGTSSSTRRPSASSRSPSAVQPSLYASPPLPPGAVSSMPPRFQVTATSEAPVVAFASAAAPFQWRERSTEELIDRMEAIKRAMSE